MGNYEILQNLVSFLSSPYWESVNDLWIGGTLLLLSVLVVCSQALTLARYRSRRMYLVSVAFLLFAGILMVPFADSRSPREFQYWLMQPQTLGTLSVLQILWTCITVFASVQVELDEKKKGMGYLLRNISTRFFSVLPAPAMLLSFLWIEQNLLIATAEIRPKAVGIQTAGMTMIVMTLLFIAAVHFLSKYRLIGLHVLVGCLLCMTCVLLPCLPQGVPQSSVTAALQSSGETLLFACGGVLLILLGAIWPRKSFMKFHRRSSATRLIQ